MSSGKESATEPGWLFALAGLEAGILGALILIGWLLLVSVWLREPVWSVPNLMASAFYGAAALRPGFGKATCAGLALLVAAYGFLGAIFGAALRGRGNGFAATLLGVTVGIAWYYLSFRVLWKSVNPAVIAFSPNRHMLIGHILYGAFLGRSQRYWRRLSSQASAAARSGSAGAAAVGDGRGDGC